MSSEDVEVINAMRRFGGGFVKTLAELAGRADDANLARVREKVAVLCTKFPVYGK